MGAIMTTLCIILACMGMGALARHGLGGAWARAEAVVLFTGCLIPAMGIYAFDMTWTSAVIGVAIVAVAYCDLLCKQYFGNLWLSVARYGAPVLFVVAVTGVPWLLAAIPIQFAATKYAKGKFPDGFDPHERGEYVIGACMGAVYSAGPLLRGY